MRSPVRIWVAAPKKAPADAGAFWFVRLPADGGGYCRVWCIAAAARWYPAFAADIRFAVRWAQRPAACPALRSVFRGALHGGCYPRLQARGALHAFFHYYKSQIALDCGASAPPRLRFRCRVRDFAAVCGFFICRGVAADSGENAGFTPESFFRRWDALALCAPLVCRKNFSPQLRAVGRRCLPDGFSVRIAGGENAFVKAPKNDTFCKFERKFIHFTQFFIDKRRCLPYN